MVAGVVSGGCTVVGRGGARGPGDQKNCKKWGFLVHIGVGICRHLQGPWRGDLYGRGVHMDWLPALYLDKRGRGKGDILN